MAHLTVGLWTTGVVGRSPCTKTVLQTSSQRLCLFSILHGKFGTQQKAVSASAGPPPVQAKLT